jgi:hypothetical protein
VIVVNDPLRMIPRRTSWKREERSYYNRAIGPVWYAHEPEQRISEFRIEK